MGRRDVRDVPTSLIARHLILPALSSPRYLWISPFVAMITFCTRNTRRPMPDHVIYIDVSSTLRSLCTNS